MLPFFFLARRLCGPVPALFAAVLLAVHPGYLHFSRSGWENVQICLWTLLAMEAVTRAQQRGHALWWVIAGISAGVGAYAYFAGRAIVIFLLLYSAARIIGARGSRLRAVWGPTLMLAAFVLTVAPLYPSVSANWDHFNRRAAKVLVTRALPADASEADLAERILDNSKQSVKIFSAAEKAISLVTFLWASLSSIRSPAASFSSECLSRLRAADQPALVVSFTRSVYPHADAHHWSAKPGARHCAVADCLHLRCCGNGDSRSSRR